MSLSRARILSVVGDRPQFVKLAAFSRAAEQARAKGAGIAHSILHIGQHHDWQLPTVFFGQLELPEPDFSLGVPSGRKESRR